MVFCPSPVKRVPISDLEARHRAGAQDSISKGPNFGTGRGNLDLADRHVPVMGSIPACAGKPRARLPFPIRLRVHPRVRGETSGVKRSMCCCRGSIPACTGKPKNCRGRISGGSGPSPRARGNHVRLESTFDAPGSIPACAGKPDRRSGGWSGRWVPSPRARGNRFDGRRCSARRWSIPACAGKPP